MNDVVKPCVRVVRIPEKKKRGKVNSVRIAIPPDCLGLRFQVRSAKKIVLVSFDRSGFKSGEFWTLQPKGGEVIELSVGGVSIVGEMFFTSEEPASIECLILCKR